MAVGSVKRLALLGSTGSIGTQTLDVVRAFPDRLQVVGLAARRNLQLLGAQVKEFRPKMVCCEGTAEEKAPLLSDGCTECAMVDMARDAEVDLVVTATVGDAALGPTLAAIQSGRNVAIANKESIVMGGPLLTGLARKHRVELLPLDSEPNAIWQCLSGETGEIARLIITASGGAFRSWSPQALADVTPAQALNHPTWSMGAKITVDSATLMNKAFEVIEARWLFDVPWDRIQVVIHPQSIIHSMVEFVDGSVKAQLSPPDMRLPIQYALLYPDRAANPDLPRLDPIQTGALTFGEMDEERYPCFKLALEIGMRGKTWPAALCGADEMAVELFLSGRIGFLEIGTIIDEALRDYRPADDPSPEELLEAAQWARRRVSGLAEG